MTSPPRRPAPPPPDSAWPATAPAPLRPLGADGKPAPHTRHGQLDGLDVNETDSQTVFDRFFGLDVPKKR